MQSLASITITGEVNSELQTLNINYPDFVCFSVAVTYEVIDLNGNQEKETNCYNCFSNQRNLCKAIVGSVKKGSLVTIVGTPKPKVFVSQGGFEESVVEVEIEKIAIEDCVKSPEQEEAPYAFSPNSFDSATIFNKKEQKEKSLIKDNFS